MHLSKWIVLSPPGWPKEFWWRKCLSARIPTLKLAFTARIPSQNSYIFLQFVMSEWCQKELFLSECHMPGVDRVHFDRCIIRDIYTLSVVQYIVRLWKKYKMLLLLKGHVTSPAMGNALQHEVKHCVMYYIHRGQRGFNDIGLHTWYCST